MRFLNSILYVYTNMDKNSKFLLSMILLIIFLLILIVVASLISKKKEEKKRQNIVKNSNTVSKPKIDYEEKVEDIQIKPTINLNKEEKIEDQIEEIEELKDDEEEIEVIEVISDEEDDSIENIKKLIENNMQQEPINLNEFEREQEESAIISYDELVRKAGAKKIVYKTNKEIKEENQMIEERKKSTFKPSKIVSPVYGVQDNRSKQDEILESFDKFEDLKRKIKDGEDEDMKRDIDFLSNLKKFRSELD